MKKFSLKRILVPMDVSGPSFSALEAAKGLARRAGGSIDVVHVKELGINPPIFFPSGAIAGFPEIRGVQKSYQQYCLGRLNEAAKGFPAARIKVRSMTGEPSYYLPRLARGAAADLVVMGTHGYAGLDRALFGSLAETVIRRATVPVLAVPEKTEFKKLTRLLVPYNMTPYAGKTLAYALEFAKVFGAKVTVLYAVSDGEERRSALGRLESSVRREAGQRMAQSLDLRVERGESRQVIFAESRRGKYDLMALSAHQRHFSSDIVIGSTVERALRHSKIPVLAVPSVSLARWRPVRLSIGGVPGNELALPV